MNKTARNVVVGGTLSASQIRTAGNIISSKFGAVSDSLVFAGVSSSLSTLPTSASDFTSSAEILSFIVTGIPHTTFALVNSDIAAEEMGKVIVRGVDTSNSTPFGFAAGTLASFQNAEPPLPVMKWTPAKPVSDLTFAGEFTVKFV